jgi:hypothetical protein
LLFRRKGKAFIEALKSESLQKLGWEQHGFRSAVPGILNDPSIFDLAGIPSQVNSVCESSKFSCYVKNDRGSRGIATQRDALARSEGKSLADGSLSLTLVFYLTIRINFEYDQKYSCAQLFATITSDYFELAFHSVY